MCSAVWPKQVPVRNVVSPSWKVPWPTGRGLGIARRIEAMAVQWAPHLVTGG
jgi:hypothetical protein